MEATININMKLVVACLVAVGAITIGYKAWQHHTNTKEQATTQAQPDPFGVDPFANKGTATTPSTDTGASSVALVQTTAPASQPVAVANTGTSTTTEPKLSGKSFAKANNVGINLSQELLDKGDLRGAISSYYEGFRSKCYPDNIGIACAYGFNTYFHDKAQTATLAKPILTDQNQFDAFVAQAKVRDMLPSTRSISFTPEQGAQLLSATYEQYDSPIKKLLGKDYDKLSENEKAAMFYNDYKAGSPYSSLASALKRYVANPSPATKADVLKNIHYSYMLNGKRIEDIRGTAGVQAMFASKDAFAAIIGKNPAYITSHDLTAEIPAYKGMHFNNVQSIDDQTPDPVGIIKEQYFEEGKPVPFSQDDLVEAAKQNAKPAVVRRGNFAAANTWY